MQRNYISHDQRRRSPERSTQPLVQHILTWSVVAIMMIVVFGLLGARILELYHQFVIGFIF